MSHEQQRRFVEILAASMPHHFHGRHVLEVGSLDINGTVRSMFVDGSYVGIDVAPGRGVDVVCQGQDYAAPDESFDHVLSCEVMEHNPHWQATFTNMIRLCRAGGLVTMTCATTGRPEHGTRRSNPTKSPLTVELDWDYYLNLREADFRAAVDLDAAFSRHLFGVNWNSYDLYFCGLKRGDHSAAEFRAWKRFEQELINYLASENARKVCRYRAFAARYLGNSWFSLWRSMGRRLNSRLINYAH